MRIGERSQEQRVHDAENGGIGADPNAQRGQNHQRQRDVLPKHTQGMTEILDPELQSSRSGYMIT